MSASVSESGWPRNGAIIQAYRLESHPQWLQVPKGLYLPMFWPPEDGGRQVITEIDTEGRDITGWHLEGWRFWHTYIVPPKLKESK